MIVNEYLRRLQEASPPTQWRHRVDVYILKDDKIIVGFKKEAGIYLPCGGGVEKGQTLEKAAEVEALEELGIQIMDVSVITPETYKVDWYKMQASGVEMKGKILERMKKYRGAEIHSMKGTFVNVDKKYYNRDKDAMKPFVMTKQRLLKELKANSWEVNKYRVRVVKMI